MANVTEHMTHKVPKRSQLAARVMVQSVCQSYESPEQPAGKVKNSRQSSLYSSGIFSLYACSPDYP